MIEPGAYATEFGKSATRANPLDVYDTLHKDLKAGLMQLERGNPQATSEALFKVVDAEQPPLRLILSSKSLPQIRSTYLYRPSHDLECLAGCLESCAIERKHGSGRRNDTRVPESFAHLL